MKIQKITPFLWFDNQAAEAAEFYCSVFKNSKIVESNPMITTFELEGQQFIGLNGGPQFKFTEAVSFFINCDTQEEVDEFWFKLTDGGSESQCGWLKDKYGLSWQVVPETLLRLLRDTDREKAQRVFNAMLKMQKIDISKIEAAYENN
jgi:predicted 3-demethylubiquinone-9 3-methyltransferase (glyoxalase superfamily)